MRSTFSLAQHQQPSSHIDISSVVDSRLWRPVGLITSSLSVRKFLIWNAARVKPLPPHAHWQLYEEHHFKPHVTLWAVGLCPLHDTPVGPSLHIARRISRHLHSGYTGAAGEKGFAHFQIFDKFKCSLQLYSCIPWIKEEVSKSCNELTYLDILSAFK